MSLSDKIEIGSSGRRQIPCFDYLPVKDVKEFIKKIKEFVKKNEFMAQIPVEKLFIKLEEEAGEKLIEK